MFVVLGDRVLTPALTTGALAGVTRALVLEWSEATEAELSIDVLEQADEVFLTSTTRDVQAVSAVVGNDGVRTFGSAPGSVTRQIAATFARRSREDPEP